MGDLFKFISLPQHQNIFYKITSGSIAFSVEGEGQAAVGLAERQDENCKYWIVIGDGQCWLEKDGRRSYLRNTPHILSNDVSSKFWIAWHSARLQFGKTSDGIPLISKKISAIDIRYVTFSVYAESGRLLWKLYLPPKLNKPVLKELKKSDPVWIAADNHQLPDGALIGGYDRELLYIIRANHEGVLVPGKFLPSLGLGFITYLGQEHQKDNFEVLCGYNCIWVPLCNNEIPLDAVQGGYSPHNDQKYYIGRAFEDGNLIVGYVILSNYDFVCLITYKGKQITKNNYEVLVNPQISMYINGYFATHMEFLTENRPKPDSVDDYVIALRDHEDDEDTSESEPENEYE